MGAYKLYPGRRVGIFIMKSVRESAFGSSSLCASCPHVLYKFPPPLVAAKSVRGLGPDALSFLGRVGHGFIRGGRRAGMGEGQST